MLGTNSVKNLSKKTNFFNKNCIDFCYYNIHSFYKYSHSFAQLHTLNYASRINDNFVDFLKFSKNFI